MILKKLLPTKNTNNKNQIIKNKYPEDKSIQVTTFFIIMIELLFFFVFYYDFKELHANRIGSILGTVIFVLTFSIFVYKILFFIFMVFKYLKYKPLKSVPDS